MGWRRECPRCSHTWARLTPWSLPSLEYLTLLVSLQVSLLASGELQGKTGSRGPDSWQSHLPSSVQPALPEQSLQSAGCTAQRNKGREVLTKEAAECLGTSSRRFALLLFLRILFDTSLTHWNVLCLWQGYWLWSKKGDTNCFYL